MEYTTVNPVQEKNVDVQDLLVRLSNEQLTSTGAYQSIIDMHKGNIHREYKLNMRKGADFFESGFSGIERSCLKAEEFARLHAGYYDRLKAEQHAGYRIFVQARNIVSGYLGRDNAPLPTLNELLDRSMDFVEDIKRDLVPAREASLTLASIMAEYKNNRVVVKLNAAGQYLTKVEEEIGKYEGLRGEVTTALSRMKISDDQNCVLMLSLDNIRRYLNYWRGEETKAKQDVVFKGPEVESVDSYEELCWASVQFCDRFKNNIDNLQEHLYETKPVLDQIGIASTQLGALEQIVHPLTRLALQNVVIIGEATDKMAKIALKPELDGEFPKELSPILRGFVARVTGQKMRRDASLDQMASRIINTQGYFSRN